MQFILETLHEKHEGRFISAVQKSVKLHRPWLAPPDNPVAFRNSLKKYADKKNISLLAISDSQELIGCVNLNEIVRGHFQSACKGYYVFSPFHAQHLMKRVMTMVISNAFGDFELHRLEAKIQAANTRSIGLMHSPGFRYEGTISTIH